MMMAGKGWKMVQPHVPLIKFRKGGINRATAAATAAPSGQAGVALGQQSSTKATGPGVTVLPTIEDYQLPPRYHRRGIDEREIEYINRGGPE